MPEHDDDALGVALADLADTMPDDPYRVDAVHAVVRRQRNHRRVRRSALGLAAATATVAGLVVLRPAPSHVATVPASEPTPPSLPACGTLTPVDTAPPPNPVSTPDAKATAAAAHDAPTGAPVNGRQGVKGYGTVASVTDTSITVTLAEQGPGLPAEVTAAFTNKTSFYDGDAEVTDRPAVNAGDSVAFASVVNDSGGYELILLQVHPMITTTTKPATGDVVDAKRAAASTVDDSAYVKATAAVVSVQPDSLTLDVREGPLTGQMVNAALAPDVIYTVGDQKCVDPALAAGQVVGVLLVHGDGNTYTAQQIALFRQP